MESKDGRKQGLVSTASFSTVATVNLWVRGPHACRLDVRVVYAKGRTNLRRARLLFPEGEVQGRDMAGARHHRDALTLKVEVVV